jgi:hypothetical protein
VLYLLLLLLLLLLSLLRPLLRPRPRVGKLVGWWVGRLAGALGAWWRDLRGFERGEARGGEGGPDHPFGGLEERGNKAGKCRGLAMVICAV